MKTINITGSITLTYSIDVDVEDGFDIDNLDSVRSLVERLITEEHLGWDYNSQRDLYIGDVNELEEAE
jgi:hypothetical protein